MDLMHEPHEGYIYRIYDTVDHIGYRRLDIIIDETPTDRHFDPERVEYLVVSSSNDVRQLKIRHPWRLGQEYAVCAGRVLASDRIGKRIEAFSFGGQLQIQSTAKLTLCALESTAPIFPLYTPHDLSVWFTDKVECILARQRADWDPAHPHVFDEHLAVLDPFTLYTSCLQTIQSEPHHLYTDVASELDHEGERFVHEEIARLQAVGKWPMRVPDPDELFHGLPARRSEQSWRESEETP